MRKQFDEQLFELNREMIEMGAMCEEAILSITKALISADVTQAIKIKKESRSIDEMERNIESLCMKLLLHQHPVASDLRLISAALKMITDMERIGDHAEDIADIIISLQGHSINDIEMIEKMANETIKMLTDSIDAFVKKDIMLAEKVIRQDDIVDDYFSKIKHSIISLISHHYTDGEYVLDLLMIAKYFERIGDHATNIAEWVIYFLTGIHKEV